MLTYRERVPVLFIAAVQHDISRIAYFVDYYVYVRIVHSAPGAFSVGPMKCPGLKVSAGIDHDMISGASSSGSSINMRCSYPLLDVAVFSMYVPISGLSFTWFSLYSSGNANVCPCSIAWSRPAPTNMPRMNAMPMPAIRMMLFCFACSLEKPLV